MLSEIVTPIGRRKPVATEISEQSLSAQALDGKTDLRFFSIANLCNSKPTPPVIRIVIQACAGGRLTSRWVHSLPVPIL